MYTQDKHIGIKYTDYMYLQIFLKMKLHDKVT
jgi:hypothetical protein